MRGTKRETDRQRQRERHTHKKRQRERDSHLELLGDGIKEDSEIISSLPKVRVVAYEGSSGTS